MPGGGKMIWDSPGGYGAEITRLRRRVGELEAELLRQEGEYRAACDLLALANEELGGELEEVRADVRALAESLENALRRELKHD